VGGTAAGTGGCWAITEAAAVAAVAAAAFTKSRRFIILSYALGGSA
jgi:hypothetical protein